jgi:hypothetical protein
MTVVLALFLPKKRVYTPYWRGSNGSQIPLLFIILTKTVLVGIMLNTGYISDNAISGSI